MQNIIVEKFCFEKNAVRLSKLITVTVSYEHKNALTFESLIKVASLT